MLSGATSNDSLLCRAARDLRAGLASEPSEARLPAWRWIAEHFRTKDANTGKAVPYVVFPWYARVLLDLFPDDRSSDLPYSLGVISTTKKGGKTTLNGAIAAYLAFARAPAASELYVFANSQEQSVGRVFAAVKYAVDMSQALRDMCAVRLETSIRLRNGTTVKAQAAMHANIAGSNPYYSGWTELWGYVHPSEQRAWDEMTPPPTVRNAIRVVDTYAGYEGESALLNGIEDRLKAGERLYDDGYTLPGEYMDYAQAVVAASSELEPFMMPDDRKGTGELIYDTPLPCYVDAAGRAYGLWDEGEEARRMPWQQGERGKQYYREQEENLLPGSFQRFHLNRRAKRGGQYVPVMDWQMLEACDPWDESDHHPVVLAVDAATHDDHMALVGVRRVGGVPEECYVRVWEPQADPRAKGRAVIAPSDALSELVRLRDAGMRIAAVAYDPYQFHDVALKAASEGFNMVEFPQGGRRALADTYLRQLIASGSLRHTHAAALGAAVESADAIEEKGRTGDEKKIRIVKGAGKVDPLVALSMAVWTATEGVAADPSPLPEGFGPSDWIMSGSMNDRDDDPVRWEDDDDAPYM